MIIANKGARNMEDAHKILKRPPLTRRILRAAGQLSCGVFGRGPLKGIYRRLGGIEPIVVHRTILVPRLPVAFDGLRIALVSDLHHGPLVDLPFIERVVEQVNELRPDVVVLPGDFVDKHARYITPCFLALRHLKAKYGVFAVLGNHDHWEGADDTRRAIRDCGFVDLTNDGHWLFCYEQRLRLAGVDDLNMGSQDLPRALGDCRKEEVAIVLSHHPDFAENIKDPRVGLVLSGHTHGGQILLPLVGPPYVPSAFGRKYLHGLVQAPQTQVYISRGVGVVGVPMRLYCQPEIDLLTLRK
tara:strand:+ start:13012 stop:13908 length:897 start_codon:yes stop_codon:yes gene_type:complete